MKDNNEKLGGDNDVTLKTIEEEFNTEQAILVGLEINDRSPLINEMSEGERSLDELEELAKTAGISVIGKMLQKRNSRDAAYYIGSGKLKELSEMCKNMGAGMVIFDDELSGAQIRNIEETAEVKVVDRTTLILDIFAQRARSREGKIQVELAQLKYRLPRLTGMGGELSRLGGGIGTRGPGEQKLETDRRHIRRRINHLENQLKEISKQRELIRETRGRGETPIVAIVGYTNAGKSTLMNKLCGSDVFVEDKLFATLDPTTRKLIFKDSQLEASTGETVLMVDTVGFIRKLPTELVEAFKSTLEEAVYADLLIHVVDASDAEYEQQIKVVDEILNLLGAVNKPIIIALNKIDCLENNERIPLNNIYGKDQSEIYEISAKTSQGINELVRAIEKNLSLDKVELEILVPYNEGWVLPYIHENGKILEEKFEADGTRARIVIQNKKANKIMDFVWYN